MKSRLLLGTLLTFLIWTGCNEDSETLVPSTKPEFRYSLPQGNHDYDNRIVDWYNRGDFYILYKYTPKDVYFNINLDWQEIVDDTVVNWSLGKFDNSSFKLENDTVYNYRRDGSILNKWPVGESLDYKGLPQFVEVHGDMFRLGRTSIKKSGSVTVEEPDEVYVGKQLEWVEEMFLSFYSDTLLRIGMPLKLVLCGSLSNQAGEIDYYTSVANTLCINHGNKSIETLTQAKKLRIKEEVNQWFMTNRIFDQIKKVMEKEGFFEITDYGQFVGNVSSVPQAEAYPSGLLYAISVTSFEYLKNEDLKSYIGNLLAYKKETLEMEPASGDYNSWDYTGILHPKKDINGLIQRKYDILVEGLNEIGIDWNALVELYH